MKKIAIFSFLCVGLVVWGTSARGMDFISGLTFFKRVLTNTNVVSTQSEDWTVLTATSVWVPAGVDALVSARFAAESRCLEIGGTQTNWCEVRIMINGSEAEPIATATTGDFAFDSTDQGNATSGDYEAHSMDRYLCVLNGGGSTTIEVPIDVQVRVTNFDGGTAPSF